jgi:hypothetical protein
MDILLRDREVFRESPVAPEHAYRGATATVTPEAHPAELAYAAGAVYFGDNALAYEVMIVGVRDDARELVTRDAVEFETALEEVEVARAEAGDADGYQGFAGAANGHRDVVTKRPLVPG